MNKQELSPAEERKIKIAQIGILVALVLAVTLFVGVRVATHDGEAPPTAVVAAHQDVTDQDETDQTPSFATPATTTAGADDQVADSAPLTPAGEAAEAVAAPATEEPRSEPAPREPVTYAEAEQVFRDGDHEEAAELFSSYVQDHGSNAWGHYMLGLAEFRAGDADAAEDAFLAALDLKPDHLKSLVNYARVLITQERNEEARTQVEMALAVNPASIEAARVMGRVQHNLGLLAEAEDTYRTILVIREDDVWSLNNLGLVLIEQERFAEALSPLAKAAALDEEMACIQNNLGIALERTGYLAAAGEAYARAMICDTDHEKSALNLARVEGLSAAADGSATDLAAPDLGALAAAFTPRPRALTVAEAEAADSKAEEVDMEVASALDSSATATDDPE